MIFDSLNKEGRLPADWKWAMLGDLCLKTETTDPRKSPDIEFRYIDISSIDRLAKSINSPAKLLGKDAPSRARRVVRSGDVLVATTRPNLNAVALVGNEFDGHVCSTGICVLRPDRDLLDSSFLYFATRTESFINSLSGSGQGAMYPAVTDKQVLGQNIPLPPLAEQKRIVAVLSEQMEAVERAKKAAEERLDTAQALREALLHNWFAAPTCEKWPLVTLGNLVQLRNEIVHPKDNPTGAATFVGLEHIASGTGKRLGHEYIEKSELTGRKPVFRKGDIVYGYLRPYLNKVWVGEFDGLCSVDQYVYKVDTNRVRPCFLARFMRSGIFLQRAPISESPGQLPRIRTQEVASVSINLPPLSVQKAIESSMLEQEENVETLLNAVSVEKESLDNITSALLRRAFSG